MAERKFNIGDKVIVNKRCPKELLSEIRSNRVRTISHRAYDPQKKATYYSLGHNYRGTWDRIECYLFRSYMLSPVVKGRKVGRPRQKRKYRRKNND